MKEYSDIPSVSVCIANYNGEHLLDDCIGSVRAQNFPFPVEILVHDDASTDASLQVLEARHQDVVVITSQTNVGYCKSNNRLAKRARGKYLLLLNNDATLRPNALRTLYAAAEEESLPAALSLPQYDHTSGALVDRGVRLDLLHTPFANRNEHCSRLAYVQAACMLVRRKDWNDLGGFPEWMESNAEDTYFCALIRLVGGRIAVIEGSGYDHRQGTSFGGNRTTGTRLSTTYRRRYLSERNRAGMILVCTPTFLAWPLFSIQLLAILAEGLLLSFLKMSAAPWGRIYWAAFRSAVSSLAVLRKDRVRVQSMRKIGAWRYLSIQMALPQKIRVALQQGIPELR